MIVIFTKSYPCNKMPFKNFEDKKPSYHTFTFRKGIPKFIAISLCLRARRHMSHQRVWFNVEDSYEEVVIDGSFVERKEIQCIAYMSDEGASQLKTNLEQIVKLKRSANFGLPLHALEFLSKVIKQESGFDIDYFVERDGEKYKSRIEVFGIERDEFINTIREYQEKYQYNIPQLLSVIVKDRMKCEIEREDLDIVPCGENSIVYPRGEKADDFYEEFNALFHSLDHKNVEFPGEKDEILKLACKEVQVKDVYYFIKNQVIKLKGFENLELFASTISIKLEQIKKDRIETPQIIIDLLRSDTPKSIERGSPTVNFRCDSRASRASSNTFESLEEEILCDVTFGEM